MYNSYYFDFAAGLIVFALLIAILLKKLYKTSSSKIFIYLVVLLLLDTTCDAVVCFPHLLSVGWIEVFTTAYHIIRNLTVVVYLWYLFCLCGIDKNVWKNKKLFIGIVTPITLVIIMVFINPLTHLVFYYETKEITNEAGEVVNILIYNRGPFIIVSYLCGIFYLIATLVVIIRFRSLFTLREIISICMIFPLTLVSLILQYIFPKILIEMFATAASAVFISVTIEKETDLVEPRSGVGTARAFYKEVKKSYLVKDDYYHLVFKIKNYYELYNFFSYEAAIKYLNKTSLYFTKTLKEVDPNLKSYYLEDGIFAIITSSYEYAEEISKKTIAEMSKMRHRTHKFAPIPQVVIIKAKNDFPKFCEFESFVNNYKDRIHLNSDINIYSEIKEDKNFKIMLNIDKIIDDGLKNNEFVVYYQPIYNVKDKKFYSAEALVRLISKEYGFISPGFFIPAAEQSGRVVDIDKFVFDSVCEFIASDEFKKSGLKYIEVNFSMLDCIRVNLYDEIVETMNRFGITPDTINIEITESYDHLNGDVAKENLEKLREYGFKFSLDDYGTGYSNIKRFSILPISYVKIDKSLVDSSADEKMQIVLKNTFKLIKSLSRKTIIEGIETEEQAKRFIDFECDNIQGYYYSKPLGQADFVSFLYEKNEIE